MNGFFLELTLVLILATILGIVAKFLKQPTILGYIAAGMIIKPFGLLHLDNIETLDAMAQMGITLLLFLVGMEMRLKELRYVGKPALITGIGQIVFTSVIGYGLVRLLGYAAMPAFYIALALTFSSTIIVVKLLSEKNVLDSLHGKLVVGFLLIQDFVALLALLLITSLNPESGLIGAPWLTLSLAVMKGILLFVGVLALGKYVIPKLLHVVGHSQELLFLASLAWGLGLAAFVTIPQVGLTIEIGGFLAGISLASSMEHFQISSRIKSLRDFFIVIFFMVLGSKIVLSNIGAIWLPTVALSAFVLIGNPLIVMAILGLLGYKSRTSFLASITVAQISEFSLILVALGQRIGHIDETIVSLVTAIGIITITLSSYLIMHGESLHNRLKGLLKIFEFDLLHPEEAGEIKKMTNHIVLVGCHRMGHNIVEALNATDEDFLVVDFNPDIVEELVGRGIPAMYGDITDPDIQDSAGLKKAKLVISTIPTYEESRILIEYMETKNKPARVILTGEHEHDGIRLYEAGADYVLLPHFIGGQQLAQMIAEDNSLQTLRQMKDQDLRLLSHEM